MTASWFQRFLLPGLAFKAVVIGGGYATGRELAEFFLPSGTVGRARRDAARDPYLQPGVRRHLPVRAAGQSWDYRTFFKALLGPRLGPVRGRLCLFIILILAVYGAAAGAIGAAMLGLPPSSAARWPPAIVAFVTFGNPSVERMFDYVSYLLYGVYALFVLCLHPFRRRSPRGSSVRGRRPDG